MMNRKERRAAAHAARKAERKVAVAATPTAEPVIEPVKAEISDAQLAANRLNAQSSTGPTSSAGLKKISLNALKTGLTGTQVLLPTDDAALYETHVRDYKNEFQPVGPEETYLLQSIIDTRWRLARVPGLETALLDLGRRQLVRMEPGLADNPAPVLEMQARVHLDRDLRNLHLQENRLVRRREREMKELRSLQAARKTAEREKSRQPQVVQKAEPAAAAATATAQNGFVFTPPVLDEFLAILTPETRAAFLQEMAEAGQTMQAAA